MSNQWGNNNQFNQNQKSWEANVFNDDKLFLYGKPIQEGGWNPRFRVKMRGNNPCFEVSTGLKDKRDRQIKHDIPLQPRVFEEFLYVVETVASYKGSISLEMENWNYSFNWNPATNKSERSQEVEVIARISIAKDDNGLIHITFAFRNGKSIVPFTFEADQYHKWMRDGNYLSDGEHSKVAALAWAKLMREVYAQMFVTNWEEPEWQKQRRVERMNRATGGGGGGGGGYQGNRNNQGNNNFNRQNQQQNQQQNQGGNSGGNGYNNTGGGGNGQNNSAGGGNDFDNNFGSNMSFDDDIPL